MEETFLQAGTVEPPSPHNCFQKLIHSLSFDMHKSVVVLGGAQIEDQAYEVLANVAVYEMGFGMFPPNQRTLDFLLQKKAEDIFVPLIIDMSGGNDWEKFALNNIIAKFPSAHIIRSTDEKILYDLDIVKEREALYPGIASSQHVRRALNYAFDNLSNVKLSEQDMEHVTGLSKNILEANFLVATGKTPWQCVIDLRLQQAERLLRDADLQITEVASAVGYDSNYFSSAFKKHSGVTPTKFRADSRQPTAKSHYRKKRKKSLTLGNNYFVSL